MATTDPYRELGLSPDATEDEVKTAYRALAKRYHPDLNPGDAAAAEKMNRVNEAYDRIRNPSQYTDPGGQGQSPYDRPPYGQGGAYGGYGQNGPPYDGDGQEEGNPWAAYTSGGGQRVVVNPGRIFFSIFMFIMIIRMFSGFLGINNYGRTAQTVVEEQSEDTAPYPYGVPQEDGQEGEDQQSDGESENQSGYSYYPFGGWGYGR